MSGPTRPVSRASSLVAPLLLFGIAFVVRIVAIGWVSFPPTEGSLYYLDVARNLVQGHGLTTDVLWSYATPPLTLPRPAFDLWLPLASLVAAVPMAIAGTAHQVGQLGGALLGACLAPLTWAVAREATRADSLDARRSRSIAVTAGLLAAVLGPWLVATVAPDSTIPFAVLGTLDALLVAHLLRPRETGDAQRRWIPGLVLGLSLGLTYLARQEVVWIGITLLVLALPTLRRLLPGARLRGAAALLGPVFVGGLVVVLPWLIRQQATFSGAATGQAVDNLFLLRNEQIFSIHDSPTLNAWLAQGVGDILWAPVRAAGTQLIDLLLLGAFPIGVAGMLAVLGLRGRPSLRRPTALVVLLLSGALTFVATALLFPVATLWGTFAHASGPLLVGLIVAAVLGVDALMAHISVARGWDRINVIVGPATLLALAVPMALVQLASVANSASTFERRLGAVRTALIAAGADTTLPLMSDHPMSLAWSLDRPVLVLPDDPPWTLAEVARETGVRTLILFDDRGDYPDVLLTGLPETCLADDPQEIGLADDPAWLFQIDASCVAP